MTRYIRFTFLCNKNERQAISDLAARLQRSQSDAVRFVVIEVARQLSLPGASDLIFLNPISDPAPLDKQTLHKQRL